MTRLMRSLMVVVMGLMVGIPMLADDKASKVSPVSAGDCFDALAVAEVNIKAALEGTLADGSGLSHLAKSSLTGAVTAIDESRKVLGKTYPTQLEQSKNERPNAESTVLEQVAEATGRLSDAADVINRLEVNTQNKQAIRIAKTNLHDASIDLSNAKELVAQEDAAAKAAGVNKKVLGEQPQPQSGGGASGKAVIDKPPPPAQTGVKHFGGWQSVVSIAAVVIALIAIVLVFLPIGPVAKLRSDKASLEAELASVKSKQSKLKVALEDLSKENADLDRKLKKLSAAAKQEDHSANEDWTTQERRVYERRKAASAGGETDARAMGRGGSQASSSRVESDSAYGDDVVVPAPVKAVPKPRAPLADYNEARAKKAADRATEFSQMYPKHVAMACSNPSARNSGPFTDLRFKEDDFGNFMALPDGKQALLFPGLTYDYSTGRKTLEGVFEYPEVESATFRLTQAAVLEKRGEEWALVRQGVFQNG